MTANEITPRSNFHLERAATSPGQDATHGLLAAIAVFALTASMVSIGIFMAVLAQTVPTISLVEQVRTR